jgi:transposase
MNFSLERHVPERHLLRLIDRFVELDGLRRELAPFYSAIGRPSIDPELMIRMRSVRSLAPSTDFRCHIPGLLLERAR